MHKSLALAFVMVLPLAGCSGNGNQAKGPGVDDRASADVLVKNAVETRTSLSSIAGKGVMRIVDQPNQFGLVVNADLVADDSDRLRIRADKLAGAIQAFDVVMLGDDIGFYIPTQNTLYHGKVRDLQYFSFNFDPDEVLRQMLRPEAGLLLKHWRRAETGAEDPRNTLAVEEDAPIGRPRLRLAIDRRTGMLASVTQLDGLNQPVMIKRYDDYRNLGQKQLAKGSLSGVVFPYLISFSWPRERRMMEMHFKSVEGNAVVLDDDFDIATSAGTRYLPLVEARMEGDEPMAAMSSERAYAVMK
ncbi:MAG: hypothetical protein FWG74_06450 [Planctomycetes bacterium]|nr:hypothetical protein [Planctomycetota bacterium]